MNARAKKGGVDKMFLWLVLILLFIGTITFISASLSILAINEPLFYRMIFTQLVLGVLVGGVMMLAFSKIKYTFWQKFYYPIFIISIVIMCLLFIPGLGFEHGGATRWIDLGFTTFQPAEFLKIGVVIFLAGLFSQIKRKVNTFRGGFIPYLLVTALVAGLLLWQPDTGTFLAITASTIVIYFVAGARWRDILTLLIVGVLGVGLLISFRPYLLERIKTFSDPSRDIFGASYQIRQSTIAIGSGKLTGRGLGQSVQKFQYLPEQTGDAIFAIYAEEFGFIGGMVFLVILVLFFLRGLRISKLAPDMFSRLLSLGIVILIAVQSFINISAITGIIPLTGLPLAFMSHGGTSLFIMLLGIGIVLNISRFKSRFHKKIT